MAQIKKPLHYRRTTEARNPRHSGFMERTMFGLHFKPTDVQTLADRDGLTYRDTLKKLKTFQRTAKVHIIEISPNFIDRTGKINRVVTLVEVNPQHARPRTTAQKCITVSRTQEGRRNDDHRLQNKKVAKIRARHIAAGTYNREIENELEKMLASNCTDHSNRSADGLRLLKRDYIPIGG